MKNEEIDILNESEHNQVLEEILQLMNKEKEIFQNKKS